MAGAAVSALVGVVMDGAIVERVPEDELDEGVPAEEADDEGVLAEEVDEADELGMNSIETFDLCMRGWRRTMLRRGREMWGKNRNHREGSGQPVGGALSTC
uniref:Uncharacterized protein n=1 Tax=Cacopsylla melanoneura TaxID=428564 RepID=A0A8D9BTU8_9HEMI